MYKLFFPLIYIVLPTYLFSTDTEILLHACTQKETNWCYTQTHHPGVNKAGKKKKKTIKTKCHKHYNTERHNNLL